MAEQGTDIADAAGKAASSALDSISGLFKAAAKNPIALVSLTAFTALVFGGLYYQSLSWSMAPFNFNAPTFIPPATA